MIDISVIRCILYSTYLGGKYIIYCQSILIIYFRTLIFLFKKNSNNSDLFVTEISTAGLVNTNHATGCTRHVLFSSACSQLSGCCTNVNFSGSNDCVDRVDTAPVTTAHLHATCQLSTRDTPQTWLLLSSLNTDIFLIDAFPKNTEFSLSLYWSLNCFKVSESNNSDVRGFL